MFTGWGGPAVEFSPFQIRVALLTGRRPAAGFFVPPISAEVESRAYQYLLHPTLKSGFFATAEIAWIFVLGVPVPARNAARSTAGGLN